VRTRNSRLDGLDRARARRWATFGARRASLGLTLVETVVAVGLLIVALNILAQMMFHGIRETQAANRQAQAILLAQERMDDLFAHRGDLAAWDAAMKKQCKLDANSDSYYLPNPAMAPYRWNWQIGDREGSPGLKEATVRTYWRRPRSKVPWAKCEVWSLLSAPAKAGRRARR